MNMWTHLIAQYAEVSLDKAKEIQEHIDVYVYLDWSECTFQEFHLAVTEAMNDLTNWKKANNE